MAEGKRTVYISLDEIADNDVKKIVDDKHDDKDLMTLEQVASFLGFSNSKIYQMVHNNEIPAFKVSRSWRFSRNEILKWLEKHTYVNPAGDGKNEWNITAEFLAERIAEAKKAKYEHQKKICMQEKRNKSEKNSKVNKNEQYEAEIRNHNERKNELTVLELMKRTGLFRGMNDKELHTFLIYNWPEKRLYRKGEAVMFETEKLNKLYIIESGSLAALLDISDVDAPAKKYFREGSMIGLDVMMSDVKTSYMDVWAEEDTFVITFSVDKMMDYMYSKQTLFLRFATNAMKLLSDENIRWMKQTRLLMEKSIREKIIYYLRLEERKSSDRQIKIMDNRQGMASHLGINRSVLSRELMLMKEEGLIDFNRNNFTILTPARILYGISGGISDFEDDDVSDKENDEEQRGVDIPLSLKQLDDAFESYEEKEMRLEKERGRLERHINRNESKRRGRPRGSRTKKDGVI